MGSSVRVCASVVRLIAISPLTPTPLARSGRRRRAARRGAHPSPLWPAPPPTGTWRGRHPRWARHSYHSTGGGGGAHLCRQTLGSHPAERPFLPPGPFRLGGVS